MKRSRLTEEQIIGVLREQEAGMRVAEVCRKHGISEPTFYSWKAKFGGVSISDAKRLWQLDRAHRITALRVGSTLGDPARRASWQAELVAVALINKGVVLRGLHLIPDAITAFDEGNKRFTIDLYTKIIFDVFIQECRSSIEYNPRDTFIIKRYTNEHCAA
jgi:putative transposase